MSLTNLWEETIEELSKHDLTWDDVDYVGGNSFIITKKNFEEVAKKTNYDDGFGGQEVAEDLKICGYGWWLERNEYDGSEWWEYKTEPQLLGLKCVEITKLADDCHTWQSLGEMNDYKEPQKGDTQ